MYTCIYKYTHVYTYHTTRAVLYSETHSTPTQTGSRFVLLIYKYTHVYIYICLYMYTYVYVLTTRQKLFFILRHTQPRDVQIVLDLCALVLESLELFDAFLSFSLRISPKKTDKKERERNEIE